MPICSTRAHTAGCNKSRDQHMPSNRMNGTTARPRYATSSRCHKHHRRDAAAAATEEAAGVPGAVVVASPLLGQL